MKWVIGNRRRWTGERVEGLVLHGRQATLPSFQSARPRYHCSAQCLAATRCDHSKHARLFL
jgi:hypothetical protein